MIVVTAMKKTRVPGKSKAITFPNHSPQEPVVQEAAALMELPGIAFDPFAGLAAAVVNPMPDSAHPAGATAAFVFRQQVHSLFETAQKLGVPGRVALEMVTAEGRPFLEQEISAGYATPEEGLTTLLHAEGGCVPVAEARKLFHRPDGVSRQTMSEKIRARELIAYRTGGGQYVLPTWQFRPEGGLLRGLPEVLRKIREKLPHADDLFAFTFFLQADPVIGGRTPLEALRAGDVEAVLEAVDGYAG